MDPAALWVYGVPTVSAAALGALWLRRGVQISQLNRRARAMRPRGVVFLPRKNGMPMRVEVLGPQPPPKPSGPSAPPSAMPILKGVDGREYVHIERDGSARALSDDEVGYLGTDFVAFDGGRPYIKQTYDQRTPSGLLHGFLHRAALPEGMTIAPAEARIPPPDDDPWVIVSRAIEQVRSDAKTAPPK